MKRLLLVFVLFLGTTHAADQDTRVKLACVGDVTQFEFKEYILVSETIDNNTGLVKGFSVGTTYLTFDSCNYAIKNLPFEPSEALENVEFDPKPKCYTTSNAALTYHLVFEKRQPGTGLVVELKALNEFFSLKNCLTDAEETF